MLYMLPFIYVISGPGMPIGVLTYWLTTNVWTFGQQFLVIRKMPTPGSAAETARHARINAKREKQGLEPLDFTPKKKVVVEESAPIRVQPKANKDGRKLSDEERLEAAREARRTAQEERRRKRDAAEQSQEFLSDGPSKSNPLNKNKKKKR
jgi:YidC/Oxa1 family membrane protein insertase